MQTIRKIADFGPLINQDRKRTSQPAQVDILLVEDDKELAAQTTACLQAADYKVRHVASLADAETVINADSPSLVILDRMLPDGDGLDFLRCMQEEEFNQPCLVLSALGDSNHRVQGLNGGADDYLAKPFDADELLARVGALIRRLHLQRPSNNIRVGDLRIDPVARTASRGDTKLQLQPREFTLLFFLAQHVNNVVTKTMLLQKVWGLDFDPQTNVVEVHISRLRAKLDFGNLPRLLHTVRGAGYSLRVE
ncbi:MAG: response regulator transcription factor [Pseudomonadota bacterium]